MCPQISNRVIGVVNVEGHLQSLRWLIDVVPWMEEELQLACLDDGTPLLLPKDWKAEEMTVETAAVVEARHIDR